MVHQLTLTAQKLYFDRKVLSTEVGLVGKVKGGLEIYFSNVRMSSCDCWPEIEQRRGVFHSGFTIAKMLI